MNTTRTLAAFIALCSIAGADAIAQTRTNEGNFRLGAVEAPKPEYPPSLAAKGTEGVAVASVLVGTGGHVDTVVVLEAPDPLMAEAVRAAISRWTFHPVTVLRDGAQTPIAVASKLTFYFQVRNGRGRVLNPDEMPGGPTWIPEPTGARRGPPPRPPAVRRGGPDFSWLEIPAPEFARRAASATTIVLDPRERDAFRRGHHARAINIPDDELPVRAPIEIPPDKTVVVDCSQTDEFTCMRAATRLSAPRFNVAVFRH